MDLRASQAPSDVPVVDPVLCHYIIVRADLPHGSQVAQAIHAAGESVVGGAVPSGTIAVALAAAGEAQLYDVAARLAHRQIPHVIVRESDGQAMAIGIAPTADRTSVRKAVSSLPLVR